MLELDCLYNNTSFWLSLSTHEITYNLSTLSKRVRPLITLSFNHPKPTKGLDALLVRNARTGAMEAGGLGWGIIRRLHGAAMAGERRGRAEGRN